MVSDVQGGRGTDAFVLANGRPFYMNDKTFDGARGTPKLCYMNASQAIMSDSSLTYVEGSVHIGPLSIGHAWVVDKQGNVIDPTLKLTSGAINPRGYFGVPFKSEYVMKTMAKTNVYGVISHTNRDIFGAKPETFRASLKLVKYSSDQPRDEMGRFGSTGLKEQDDRIRAVLERSDANPRRIAAEATIAARGDCRNDPGVLDVNGRYTPDAHTENQRIASEFLNPNAKSDMPEATFMLGKPGRGNQRY